ncbi:MAG: hypothetical protein EA407_12590 [Rhodobacteraceae bacterium]|nr:MAG: hypothetical protein EA407_12590 [Paracoccaceae bacterium]
MRALCAALAGGGDMTATPQAISAPDLAQLDRATLEMMAAAADEIDECTRVLKKAGLNPVGEVLKGQGKFVKMGHYPKGDVFDRETQSQYYYHAHREGEHGHFHCFLRAPGMPEDVAPVPECEGRDWPAGDKALAHLVAVSMDRYGSPIRLFTTNQWVTGETWYRGTDVMRMLPRFAIDHAHPSWPTNRWLTALLRLFRPQIEALIVERDKALSAHQAEDPDTDAFTDRTLETLSETALDVAEQQAAVRKLFKHS